MKKIVAVSFVGLLAALTLWSYSAVARVHTHGHSVRAQAKKNEASPGVTKDVAPDAKQSATGGPPGGLPGHE